MGDRAGHMYILFFFQYFQTRATGMFEVRFLDYTNPGHRTVQMACCSGQEVEGSCSSPCSTFFSVCVRPLTDDSANCFFGQKTSDVLGNGSFAIPSNSLLQIPWPNTLQSWPVRQIPRWIKLFCNKSITDLFYALGVKILVALSAFEPLHPSGSKLRVITLF